MGNVTSIKGGIVVNVVSVTADTRAATKAFLQANGYICVDDSTASPGDAWDGATFTKPEIQAAPRIISHREFLLKLTDVEFKAIRAASKVNADVDRYMYLFERSQGVAINDPDAISGLQALEAAGLIGPGRAAQILTQ